MKAVNFLFFLIFLAIGLAVSVLIGGVLKSPVIATLFGVMSFFVALFVAIAIKIAYQWERAVVLRLGKFSSIKGPGMFFIVPVLDSAIFTDTRTLTLDIPAQQVITRDNVPVSVNGVLYFRVAKVEDAILKVQNYRVAMLNYALTVLRDIIGEMTLDELLAERERISSQISKAVEVQALAWGLDVETIKIQDIDMPEDLKKMMSRQASAEREKRATITKALGDKEAALNLAEAARTMAESPGAMQLRTLQTVDGLGPTASNTVVIAIPMEVMEVARGYADLALGRTKAS